MISTHIKIRAKQPAITTIFNANFQEGGFNRSPFYFWIKGEKTLMEFKIGNKLVEIKFDFRLMFKIDKELATKDANGQSSNNGIGALFYKIVDRDDQGIVDLIQFCGSKKGKAVSEDEALSAIENYFEKSDAEDPQEALFEEIQEEMVQSGFFKKKILKYIENMRLGLELAESQATENDATAQMQAKAISGIIGKMESALS
jgi:hypothetical protein